MRQVLHNSPPMFCPSYFCRSPFSTLHSPFSALLLLLLAAILSSSCSRPENQWQVGGLYSIRAGSAGSTGEGRFAIAKVLAIDPGVVSVRIYNQTFPDRPKQIDPSTLSLGSLKEGLDFGIGHLPLKPDAFEKRSPVFIMKTDVRDDELEGYRTWKKSIAGPAPRSGDADKAGQDGAAPPQAPEPASPGGPPNG